MAQKRQVSGFSVSNALKTALRNKGLYPNMQEGQMHYDSSENDVHVIIVPWEDGSYVSLNIRANGTFREFLDPNDNALVRAWTVRELYTYIFQIIPPSINNVTSVFANNTWTYTIIRNGVSYVGTDATEANAACKALTNIVNSL